MIRLDKNKIKLENMYKRKKYAECTNNHGVRLMLMGMKWGG